MTRAQIDPDIQKFIADELDSLTIMLNDMGPSTQGAVVFVLTDDDGNIHTQHTTNVDDEISRANMVGGLLSVGIKILNNNHNGEDQ